MIDHWSSILDVCMHKNNDFASMILRILFSFHGDRQQRIIGRNNSLIQTKQANTLTSGGGRLATNLAHSSDALCILGDAVDCLRTTVVVVLVAARRATWEKTIVTLLKLFLGEIKKVRERFVEGREGELEALLTRQVRCVFSLFVCLFVLRRLGYLPRRIAVP